MVPPIIQLPLGDTIGIIADTDFYQEWLNLVPVSSPAKPAAPLFVGRDVILGGRG
jgi:hypothetical protein